MKRGETGREGEGAGGLIRGKTGTLEKIQEKNKEFGQTQ